MGAYVVREVQDGRQGDPAITRERKQNPQVTLQAIVVLIMLITLPVLEVIADLCSSMDRTNE